MLDARRSFNYAFVSAGIAVVLRVAAKRLGGVYSEEVSLSARDHVVSVFQCVLKYNEYTRRFAYLPSQEVSNDELLWLNV